MRKKTVKKQINIPFEKLVVWTTISLIIITKLVSGI
jgi:hypothetical protein